MESRRAPWLENAPEKPRKALNRGVCTADGCNRPAWAKKLCTMHYSRVRVTGSAAKVVVTREERFWAKVDRDGEGCWPWQGASGQQGYGTFNYGKNSDGRYRYIAAHRMAYELLVGPIPDGLSLDHICRNPSCVNPDHLEPVTLGENNRRAHEAVPLLDRVCSLGHVIGGDNRTKSGACRTCKNRKDAERYAQRATGSRVPNGVPALIYARSQGTCEMCGGYIAASTQHVHHRKLRSQGGTHDLANLLGVHPWCHRRTHDNPAQAYALGHLVHGYDDPAQVAVQLFEPVRVQVPEGTRGRKPNVA